MRILNYELSEIRYCCLMFVWLFLPYLLQPMFGLVYEESWEDVLIIIPCLIYLSFKKVKEIPKDSGTDDKV